ncbi:hypothetical protein PSTT_06289 [Puccinia striiformis]|uniref:Uncharacterized protein n=1 Tax=Puccinia striiformis TaxID=27350 RepID=A0A2S4VKR2_9BASI|nr:hypothetical protein PSTT_06289 [Puccinia striiformis]
MNSLITTISLALLIGRSACQSSSNLSPVGQQSANDATMNGVATPVSMNTTTTANSSNGVTSTSALNATATPMSGSAVSGSTNGTSLMENGSPVNSTVSSIYVMNQDISWTNSNFSIYEQNGTVAYQITNQYAGANLTAKEFIVRDAITGEKKLKIDANENSEYTFKRAAMSIQGKILENERMVAQVTTGENPTSASNSKKQLTITSDGSIRPWDLVALMALVKTRVHACGY